MKVNKELIEEELYQAQRALFLARSVKEIKFLQKKIEYLKSQLNGK